MTDRSDPSSPITTSVLPALVLVLLASSPAAAQTCTPTPNATYGPRVSQTKPANAVELAPGSSVQTAVNAYPAGTVFWLRAGVYSITASIRPKTGNEFIGEYGACLDGTGWATSDNTQAAFRAHNQDIDHVTIRNLVIRNMPQYGIQAYKDFTNHWTIEYTEIAHGIYGLSVGSDSIVRHNYIHHNIGANPEDPIVAKRGGAYSIFFADRVLFENNEVAYNGMEQKFILTVGGRYRNNFVHHNYGDGIWFDGNRDLVIEGNRVEDNGRNGIFYEISEGGIIRDNLIRRNQEGIFVSTSQSGEIYNNTLSDNQFGIEVFVDCSRLVEQYRTFAKVDLKNISVHHNSVSVPAGEHYAGMGTSLLCSSAQAEPYFVTMTKNLRFDQNTYSFSQTRPFMWGSVAKTWAEWQALPQDVGGVIGGGVGPSPPPNVRLVGP